MKVHVSTYGCSANQASAEIMMNSIMQMGHKLVCENDAEVVVLNSCTVKYATEQKILHKIREYGKKGIEVVVTGCMPQVQLNVILKNNPQTHILGVNSISRIGDVLYGIEKYYFDDDLMPGKRIEIFTPEPEGFLNIGRVRFNPNIHICQISQGCDYRCTYCIVKLARGRLRSFDPESIVLDIETALNEGCREIWLTSQDNGQYGMDTDIRLPELLKMVTAIPGDFKVRVGMMNPFSMISILDDLVEAFSNEKIYKLLHLPIQSASDDVLKCMNRFYYIKDVDNIITRFWSKFDDITLFTDIIVGFPGEEDKDFKKTVEWVREYRPDKVNISRYTPRPYTKAWGYRNIDSRITVNRSNKLHRVCKEIKFESKKHMIGWKGMVFVSKEAKFEGFMARTDSYRPVIIKNDDLLPGQMYEAEITGATAGYFLGQVVV
ncbi:MAG: tRNA (N(6)-L-threonylcarbamoyladenosine(37)-C(2))-methylthiotransferase [Methanosarcinaceae archaeon]